MQGSCSSVCHQRRPACKWPMLVFIPLRLSAKSALPTRLRVVLAQSHHPVCDVLSWHGSLLQRPQVLPLHFEFISLERIIFQHTQGKKSRRLSSGRCLLSPLIFQMKFLSLHFTKQGGESGTCPLALLYQIMSTFSRDSTWNSGILQQLYTELLGAKTVTAFKIETRKAK